MARINFEDNTYKRIEWEKLKSEVRNEIFRTFSKHGLSPSDYCLFSEDLEATSSHVAKGLLVSAWTLAQHYWLDNRSLIPVEKWNLVKFASCVVASGFAELRDGGIYIKGSEEQFKWLEQKRDAGRKGGLAKQANHKKRDDIEGKKESKFGLGDVPWPNERDEKLSTIQDDTTHQDEKLSTFDQYDHGHQYQNPSNASQNPSNASRNPSNASPPLENFYPPTPTLSPPSPSLNFNKKEKEEKLIEASTNFVYEEKTSAFDQDFDEARHRYMKKFESIVDFEIRPSQMDKLRYSQLIKSGITQSQVLTMIDNYAEYKLPQCKPGHYPIHRKFETFLGSPVNWVCKEHLESMADKVKAKRAAAQKAEDAERDRKIVESMKSRRSDMLRKQASQAREIEAANKARANETRTQKQIAVDALGTFVLDIPFSDPKGLQKAGDILNRMNLKF